MPEKTPDIVDKQEIMAVEQLPIITEKLALISEEIETRIAAALTLECTEETVKVIKDLRADLNRDFGAMEEKRKAIKTAILAPYEKFELVYKQLVSDKLNGADRQLKLRIDAVEDELKRIKSDEMKAYFDEYCASKNLAFPVPFEATGVNVTRSASIKSLKDQCKAFVDRICGDLAVIAAQEHGEEILVEYKQSLDCSRSIVMVNARHKAIEEARALAAAQAERKAAEQAAVARVESIAPPVSAPCVPSSDPAEDVIKSLSFKVTAPVRKLRLLKQFLNDGGYHYE